MPLFGKSPLHFRTQTRPGSGNNLPLSEMIPSGKSHLPSSRGGSIGNLPFNEITASGK